MKYYEIKDTKTNRELTITAKNYGDACRLLGIKPQDGRVVYSYGTSQR